MTPTKLFILLIALHLLADFNLQVQGGMDKFKCRDWWIEQTSKPVWGSSAEQFRKYRFDYHAGMFCHALMWSIVTFAPLLWMAPGWWSVLLILVPNIAVHHVVDHLKANRYRLNLVQDQLIHLAQIVVTFAAWNIFV